MKSWLSKASTGLALMGACGAINSCALFGGGNYASQMEVETEVPESLEKGQPSQGPAAGEATYAANSGVPATSNLVEAPDSWPLAGQLPPLPGGTEPGGASVTGLPAEARRDLIDIPKPEFNAASIHNSRPPAQMLTLGPPVSPASSLMSPGGSAARPATPLVVRETVQPLTDPVPEAPEIATAPKAAPSAPAEPGVPLLHSGARLSDFYQGIHQELLNTSVVENQVTTENVVVSASGEELSDPPPAADPVPAPAR